MRPTRPTHAIHASAPAEWLALMACPSRWPAVTAFATLATLVMLVGLAYSTPVEACHTGSNGCTPTTITVTAGDNKLTVSWNSVSGVQYYGLRYRKDGTSTWREAKFTCTTRINPSQWPYGQYCTTKTSEDIPTAEDKKDNPIVSIK